MRKYIFILWLSLIVVTASAQEFKCNVTVVDQTQGSNKQVSETLQTAIFEFMNERIWTDHLYDIEERIDVTFMITISDKPSADEFTGNLAIQVRRPVYNTNYYTTMFNFVDNDMNFKYTEFEPLEFDLNSYTSNLTSILGFYAYYILGLDYDSFAFEGGSEYFKNAEKIVINASNVSETGWKPTESMSHKNRYWLAKDILDQDYAPVREFNYRYHRLGLDMMDSKIDEGRAEIASSLELLQKVSRKRPDPYMYIMRIVFDAKADEMVKIFSEAFPEEKSRVYSLLSEIDQTNTTKYKTILEDSDNAIEF